MPQLNQLLVELNLPARFRDFDGKLENKRSMVERIVARQQMLAIGHVNEEVPREFLFDDSSSGSEFSDFSDEE